MLLKLVNSPTQCVISLLRLEHQYKILVSGSSSSTPMTPERAAQLEDIGTFVLATKLACWKTSTHTQVLVQFFQLEL